MTSLKLRVKAYETRPPTLAESVCTPAAFFSLASSSIAWPPSAPLWPLTLSTMRQLLADEPAERSPKLAFSAVEPCAYCTKSVLLSPVPKSLPWSWRSVRPKPLLPPVKSPLVAVAKMFSAPSAPVGRPRYSTLTRLPGFAASASVL